MKRILHIGFALVIVTVILVSIFHVLFAVKSWADIYYYVNAQKYTNVEQEGKRLIVYRTIDSLTMRGDGVKMPLKHYKDIYIARNDSVVLLKTVEGKVIPPQPERVEWPK